jgi:hypothetical protein
MIGRKLLNRLKNTFGKLRKTKDLAEGEYLIGKPDKTPAIRILSYGLPSENYNIKYAIHDCGDFEIDDEPSEASVSFLDYDGVVVFAGAFEKINRFTKHNLLLDNDYEETSICCIASNDLDLRERELFTAIRKGKIAIFLVPALPRGDSAKREVSNTDLFRRCMGSFHMPWGSLTEPVSHLDSQIPEFQPYIEQHGVAYVYFSRDYENKDFTKVICGNNDNPVAFSFFDKVFFLPCSYPKTHEQALSAAKSAIRAAISYRKRISEEKPQWISEFRFTQETSLLNDADELQQQLNQLQIKIDSYENYKGALCYQSDPLVDIVINIFEKFFGISIESEEQCIEDAILKDEEGNIKGVFEIKGVKRNFARKDINQVDSHRERLGLQPNTPGILVMNTLMDVNSLVEKGQPPHPDIIKKAATDNVLLIRTIDLLRFADGVEAGVLNKEDFLTILMSQSGWLKVADNKYEVVKG